VGPNAGSGLLSGNPKDNSRSAYYLKAHHKYKPRRPKATNRERVLMQTPISKKSSRNFHRGILFSAGSALFN